jgi:hypothetical protein
MTSLLMQWKQEASPVEIVLTIAKLLKFGIVETLSVEVVAAAISGANVRNF